MKPAIVLIAALVACDPEAARRAAVDVCVASCAGKSPSDDDRETCRLTCAASPGDASVGHTATARLHACEGTCVERDVDDRATCRLNCVEVVSRSLAEPERRDCHHDCLEQLDRASSSCAHEGQPSDRATCSLQSDEQAQHCIDRCAAPGA